jgi:hypothetical protein
MNNGGRLDTEKFMVSFSAGRTFRHGLSIASDAAWQGSYDPKALGLEIQVER